MSEVTAVLATTLTGVDPLIILQICQACHWSCLSPYWCTDIAKCSLGYLNKSRIFLHFLTSSSTILLYSIHITWSVMLFI